LEQDLIKLEQRGYKCLQTYRAAEAYRIFQELLNKIQEHDNEVKARILYGKALAASMLGKLDEAQTAFEQAMSLLGDQLHPFKAILYESLGNVYYNQGLLKLASDYYQQALQEYVIYGAMHEASLMFQSIAFCKLAEGDRNGFIHILDKGIEFAQKYQQDIAIKELWLTKFNFLIEWDLTGETLTAFKKELNQVKMFRDDIDLQIETRLLEANYWQKRGAYKAAQRLYQEALKLSQKLPRKLWSVYLSLARFYEKLDLKKSLTYAEQAYSIIQNIDFVEAKLEVLKELASLRSMTKNIEQYKQAEKEIDVILNQLRAMGNNEALGWVLLQRAWLRLEWQHLESALKDVEEAEQLASNLNIRYVIYTAKAAIFQCLKRRKEALVANKKAIDLLNTYLFSYPNKTSHDLRIDNLATWYDRLRDLEVLNENAALLCAEMERYKEAFEWAENGKTQLLRQQLARARLEKEIEIKINFDELRKLLGKESAAMAIFCVGYYRTLVLIIDPEEAQPKPFFVNLTEHELKNMMKSIFESISEASDDALFKALPALSKDLLFPLRNVAEHYNVLYIVPDSYLYFVPFAALTFDDGKSLIEYCAVTYIPSAALLKYCRANRPNQSRSCLAIGVGSDQGIIFSKYAQAIANLPWKKSTCIKDAVADQFFSEAPHHTVIHLSCHGIMEPSAGILSASQIEFADKRVTAKDVYNLRLQAELVFINSCVSGRFSPRLGSEIEGFCRAFLYAGASSIVATLTYVHPELAHQLALNFYEEWLNGATKAEALRRAQLRMLRKNFEPKIWASHILIGDHR